MLSIYVPVKNALQINGNVDCQERMHLLTSYKDCMLKSFKENVDQAASMRNNLKDKLLKGLIISNESEMASIRDDLDLVQSNATYYLLGYLLFSRKDRIGCADCFASLTTEQNELPSDFYAAHITTLKSKGFLKFPSIALYYAFAKVERLLQEHFKSDNAYVRDSFEQVIAEVAENGVLIPRVCCEDHRAEVHTMLIYEYIQIRYHLEAKRYKNDIIKLKEQQHKLRKLSKMVVTSNE